MLTAIVASVVFAKPHFQDSPGKIVFVSDRDGNEEIYSMLADGSGVQRLTNNAGRDVSPCWSPDGKHIAWASNRSGNWDIWKMDADGKNQMNVTDAKETQDTNPMWQTNEDKIAFISNRRFYTIDPNGANLIQNNDLLLSQDCQASISPVSRRFAFRDPNGHLLIKEGWDIHIVVAMTYGQSSVPAQIYHPSWSSDAKAVIFDSGGATSKIYTVDLDDSAVDEIPLDGNGVDPVFANEDTSAVFTSPTGEGKGSDICWIDLDASARSHGLPKPINLTHISGNDSAPAFWEPKVSD